MAHSLLERVQADGTPIIDGDMITFVWQGKNPPLLLGDFNDWDEENPIHLKKAASQVWIAQLEIPRDAYIEYIFSRGGERLNDPFNPRRVTNGMGKYNHYFYMPDAAPTLLARRRREVQGGAVSKHQVATQDLVAGSKRTVYLYRPAVPEQVPLLFVWDGSDYLHRAALPVMIDNLIAEKRIQPFAIAMIQNGRQARTLEYTCSEATLEFLIECVLPLAQVNLDLADPDAIPGGYAILGASLGGLMSLYTGLRAPQVFRRILCQSGAFSFGKHDTIVYDLVRCKETQPLQIWMDAGRFEGLLNTNRRMFSLLEKKGYPVIYREYSGGHNYSSWRDDLWRGLEALFTPVVGTPKTQKV